LSWNGRREGETVKRREVLYNKQKREVVVWSYETYDLEGRTPTSVMRVPFKNHVWHFHLGYVSEVHEKDLPIVNTVKRMGKREGKNGICR
jgi:hypothetical protein